jgi:ubiquinone/menaquinone biosynthesis C-methylase UbiE
MPDTETVKKNFAEAARVLKPGGVMKIQIRGLPTVKKQWYYGPSFNLRQITSLLADMPVSIVKSEGEYRGYFWLWLEKK